MFALQQVANYCLACQQQYANEKLCWDFSQTASEWLVEVVSYKALKIEVVLVVAMTDEGFNFRVEDWETGDFYLETPVRKLSQLKELISDWSSQVPPIDIEITAA